MKRFLVHSLPAPGNTVELDPDEAHHALKVLRLQSGDRIEILDGKGSACQASLILKSKSSALAQRASDDASLRRSAPLEVVPVDLVIAVPKGDSMTWIIEKCVELGVRSVTPLKSDHGVTRIDAQSSVKLLKKWHLLAEQTLKQCGRLSRLKIFDPIDTEALLNSNEPTLWCDECAPQDSPSLISGLDPTLSARVLIGPEGGWSERERTAFADNIKFKRIQLGPVVLRVETAAIFAMSLCVARLREKTSQFST